MSVEELRDQIQDLAQKQFQKVGIECLITDSFTVELTISYADHHVSQRFQTGVKPALESPKYIILLFNAMATRLGRMVFLQEDGT